MTFNMHNTSVFSNNNIDIITSIVGVVGFMIAVIFARKKPPQVRIESPTQKQLPDSTDQPDGSPPKVVEVTSSKKAKRKKGKTPKKGNKTKR